MFLFCFLQIFILKNTFMEIYIKKNGKLTTLGEGRIYSKSQLRLNEGGVAVTLNPDGQDVNANNVQTSASNLLNKVPQATAVTIPNDDIQGATVPNFPKNDPRSDTVQNIALKNANSSTIQQAAKNGGTINIVKNNTQNNGLGESKIVEMRKNAIPFSKKELTSFLKDI